MISIKLQRKTRFIVSTELFTTFQLFRSLRGRTSLTAGKRALIIGASSVGSWCSTGDHCPIGKWNEEKMMPIRSSKLIVSFVMKTKTGFATLLYMEIKTYSSFTKKHSSVLLYVDTNWSLFEPCKQDPNFYQELKSRERFQNKCLNIHNYLVPLAKKKLI